MLSPKEAYLLQQATTHLLELGQLPKIKDRLWEVFRLAMASEEADSLSHVERSDQLFLHDTLKDFFEKVEPMRNQMVELRGR